MSVNVAPVTIRILDKEYQIACHDDERDPLLESARYLDQKMKEIRNSGKVIGSDRIAVMAALNITHDLLICVGKLRKADVVDNSKLKKLNDKVEHAISHFKQLEL